MNNFLWRLCNCYALVLLAPGMARSEVVREEIDGDSHRVVIRMTVTAADEPTPAFKYRLTLRPHELVPGNSVAHYMRAFPEGGVERVWKFVSEEFGEEVDDWYTNTPMSQLPTERFVAAAAPFSSLIENHMAPGSRCRNTDWGVSFVDIKGPDVIAFLLPEIQAMRSIGRAVSLRTRLAIFEHRYEDAIELLRMNYRLGRDVGTQPILVSGLVGVAICNITTDNAEDLIAAPGSPNLYWALTELPRPQVSFRDALRLELAIGPRMFDMLDDPESKTRTAEEWNAVWRRDANLAQQFEYWRGPKESVASMFAPLASGLTGYSHAKGRLVDWGYTAEQVEQMAVGQVLSIYSARVYQIFADDIEKVAYFNYPTAKQYEARAQNLDERANLLGDGPNREIIPIAMQLLPAVTAAQSAVVRSQRDLDALRVIEALRMHAAKNDNALPKTLDEVTCVPVPKNVATGEPFHYRLDGDTAVLLLPLSDGMQVEQRYEIKLSK